MSENLTKDSDTEREYGEAKKKVMDIGEKAKGKDGAKDGANQRIKKEDKLFVVKNL